MAGPVLGGVWGGCLGHLKNFQSKKKVDYLLAGADKGSNMLDRSRFSTLFKKMENRDFSFFDIFLVRLQKSTILNDPKILHRVA